MTIRSNVKANINWLIDNREDGSPTKFSKTVGVGTPKTNNWRKGYNAPDLEMIGHIAQIYDVSLDWLIGGDIDKAPSDYYEYSLVDMTDKGDDRNA